MGNNTILKLSMTNKKSQFIKLESRLELFELLDRVFAVFYIVFFAIGPGAIPWIITSELFGSEARGKAVSIATLVNWLSNFVVTVSFPFIQVSC